MVLNTTVLTIGMAIIFIAIVSLLFIVGWIAQARLQCETFKDLPICKLGAVQLVVMMLLLIAGGLIVVIGAAAYILLSGTTEV